MEITTATLVAERYGLGAVLGRPVYAARGELGLIWRLDTERGSWAVKESLIEVPEESAALDVAFQRAAAASGVALPAPVLTLDGRVMLRAKPHDVRVYAWAELSERVVSPADLGATASRLHQVAHPARGQVDAWFAEPLGPEAWTALAATVRRTASPSVDGWAGMLVDALPELIALDAVVRPPDPDLVITCHRDLNRDNLRYGSPAAGVVVLDWENCGPGEPVLELASVLADLAAEVSVEAAVEAHAAYVASGGLVRVAEPGDFSMAIAVQGHLLWFYATRALDGHTDAESRDRARQRLRTMLAAPLTRDGIDRVLAAVDGVR